MKSLHRLGLFSLPAAFLCAGAGMLLLLQVDHAPGKHFQQILSARAAWVNGHVFLLCSTMFLTPAAWALHAALTRRAPAIIGTILAPIVAFSSILLAGQYAIDFVMPLLADAGGEALKVHGMLYRSPLINTLFYNLPNLTFVALLALIVVVVWNGALSRRTGAIILLNCAAVLLGNLWSPVFQRSAILLLAVTVLPIVLNQWKASTVAVTGGTK